MNGGSPTRYLHLRPSSPGDPDGFSARIGPGDATMRCMTITRISTGLIIRPKDARSRSRKWDDSSVIGFKPSSVSSRYGTISRLCQVSGGHLAAWLFVTFCHSMVIFVCQLSQGSTPLVHSWDMDRIHCANFVLEVTQKEWNRSNRSEYAECS